MRSFALLLLVLAAACSRPKPDAAPKDAEVRAEAPDAAPEVLTQASMIAAGDSGAPAVAPSNAVDAEALRARHKSRLHAQTPVTVVSGGSARELGEKICQASAPKRPPETPVLLKPNLGGFDWFKDPKKTGGDDGVKGRITDPEFVRGVVRCLRARGHTKITIAEGWGARHEDWKHLIDVSGYAKMAAEEKVPLVAMDDDGVFDVEGDKPGKALGLRGMENTHVPTLLIPKILAEHLDHGLFLSLPKVKAHRFGVFSMSIKGMQGTVMLSDAAPAFRQKWRMHRELNPWLEAKKTHSEDRASYVTALEKFAERIVDVLEVETPDAVLAEGAPAMGGDGFQKLFPSEESFAIGGENPILVDRVGAELLGTWDRAELAKELGGHRTSPLLELAAKRFGVDLTAPKVVGDGAALLASPRPTHFIAMAGFSIDATPGAAVEKPTAHAVPGEAKIDGRGDDPVWKNAPRATFDTDYAGNPTKVLTTVRFAWSKTALTALFELESANLFTDTSRPTDVERPKLYEEDCIEIFLAPDPTNPRRYAELEVGPHGHFFDLFVDRDKKTEATSWSGALRIATTRDEVRHTATIEVATQAPEILSALTPGARLPLGIFRMEGKTPRLYLAFSPPRTKKPNFHVPEAFGALAIDP